MFFTVMRNLCRFLVNLFSNVLITDKNLTYYFSKFTYGLTGESL